MKIDVQLIPFPPVALRTAGKTVIVIDILRATSVMTQALSKGAAEIVPVTTVEEAFQRKKEFVSGETLLGGERDSLKIEGFDLGNSPREYTDERIRGKRLILTTTNGTKAFHLVASGKEVLAASFFNIGAIAQRCLDSDPHLLIFPSGDGGKFSLEDTVCGGMLIDRILKEKEASVKLTDASRAAHLLYQAFQGSLVEALRLSTHGRDLMNRGFEEDLAFCAQVDTTDVVPIFRDGILRAVV